MKILRINNSKGEFSINGEDFHSIDSISKDDILSLIDIVIKNECEMDELAEGMDLPNKAHSIIYKHIIRKLKELQANRTFFVDMRDNTYKEAISKYQNK